MRQGSSPEITAILNVSREGLLAHNSYQSIVMACSAAEAADITVEIVVVADRPDAATVTYLDVVSDLGARVLTVDVGDLGLARNAGVAHASGRYIAFLDGDDLWGRQWLIEALKVAKLAAEPTIWHPEASLFFGTGMPSYWFTHHDIDTERGDWTTLALRNLWTSLSFGSREIYEEVPYRATALNQGFGYEDWCWNAETIARGVFHRCVPGTVHLVRQRADSLVRRTAMRRALVTPNPLFRDRVGQLLFE